MIDLRLVEFAVALDQHRRFGRAAEAMGVTQPTFSRGIAALEAELGARLFDRSSRRVEPTPAGRLLLERARPLLSAAAGIRGALGDLQELRSGRVAVGAGPYPLDLSVTEAVARLAARHPHLEIEVIEGQWREFGPRLLSGEIELAIMESSIVAADPRFAVQPLPPHQGRFFCRPGHPLDGRKRVDLADVFAFPLVGVRLPARLLLPPRQNVSGASLDPVTGDVLPRITTTSFASTRAIVSRTDGIGIAVPTQIAGELRQGALVLIESEVETLRTAYGICRLRDRTLSPGAQALVETILEVEDELARDPFAAPSRPAKLRAPKQKPG